MTHRECLDCGHTWGGPEPVTSTRNLPDEFWRSRPVLEHIRVAAHSRLVSADAVLLGVLARAVMLAPPSIVLPPIVGSPTSLNLFAAIVDPSGGGKTAAYNVARDLITHRRTDIVDPILPSSGEGLIEAYFGFVDETGDDGKTRKVKRQTSTAGLAFVDEGQALLAQADRAGSTIMETIRSAWMGGDLGQHNATEERKRSLPAHRYRLSMVMGFQLAYAASLIADAEGGTPQRFTFALATDPALDPAAVWPGELDYVPPATTGVRTLFAFDPEIADGIRERRIARIRRMVDVDPLDTHQDLRREKLAAALALLDGRLSVELDDWALAVQIDDVSCRVRSWAVEHDRQARAIVRRAAVELAVERESAVEEAGLARTLTRLARSVARKVWRDGPMTVSQAYRVVGSRDRVVTADEVVDFAVERRWITRTDEGVAPGGERP